MPAFLASESPIAMACLGLVTFLPLRPDLRVPFFIAFISVSTFLLAESEYLRVDGFFDAVFFFALLSLTLFAFAADFLVAMESSLGNGMARVSGRLSVLLTTAYARISAIELTRITDMRRKEDLRSEIRIPGLSGET